ncbi:putative TetR family transcriptional regulator [Gordonia hirsuta DSM 44140 = NBRC 16056]|uniref:Putative TetR family transcriptional regulator n=1 Tax=Gordonia hirsuta DSM 44140 = NBRC 16056 TaxID=1121927 RepID=L7LAM2_9ACTN|nr:TetR family transcriptional regulator [Gordonia hirsuta]GAC57107.1 putative TetR family transcriptional regulator [Gordonia hirsuta DSM 44140 = NBRC 16056]
MSPTPPAGAAPAGRVRPPDRREHILDAAVTAFSAHGFHGTRLAQIADAAGISAPALYRHFDTKSDLLGAVVRRMSERIRQRLESVPPLPGDPGTELSDLLEAYLADVLDNRRHRDLYRWEARSLPAADRAQARTIRQAAHRRVRELISALRPDLPQSQADTLTDAVFATANSPTSHRVSMSRKVTAGLIRDAALAVAGTALPSPDAPPPGPGLTPTARREAVLSQAVTLFADHGFHEVTIEQIASAAGLPPSGVYRHFPSKQAILSAALERAAEHTSAAVAAGLAQADSRDQALSHLAGQYARLCAAEPEIITAYRRCFGALDGARRTELRRRQRMNVDEWATWLQDARPELPSAATRFLVHAALDVITDLTAGPHPVDAATAADLALAVLLQTPYSG